MRRVMDVEKQNKRKRGLILTKTKKNNYDNIRNLQQIKR